MRPTHPMQRGVDDAQPRAARPRSAQSGNRAAVCLQHFRPDGPDPPNAAFQGALCPRDVRRPARPVGGGGYGRVHRGDDLGAVGAVDLEAVVLGRIVAGGYRRAGAGPQSRRGVGHQRGGNGVLPVPHFQPGRGQHRRRVGHENGAGQPGVPPQHHRTGRGAVSAGGQEIGQPLRRPDDRRPVHPVGARLHRPPQPRGAEAEGPRHPFGQLLSVPRLDQSLQLHPGGRVGVGVRPSPRPGRRISCRRVRHGARLYMVSPRGCGCRTPGRRDRTARSGRGAPSTPTCRVPGTRRAR